MEFFSLVTIFILILILFILFVLVFTIIPLLIGASFEPSDERALKKIIQFARAKKGDRIVDLGSGDGRIVIAFAEKGIEAHGYEINPILVFLSRKKIKEKDLQDKAFVHWRNFWHVNLSKFDIVTIFQVGYIMKKMGGKLKKELKKNSRIISNTWEFPNLKLVRKDKKSEIYLYRV